jgi:hypothetical protein
VSETSAWQLACLPSSPQYCGATPTDSVPLFGTPVSSITSTASAPPTRRSARSASTRQSGASSQAGLLTKWCSWSCPDSPSLAAIGCTLFGPSGPSRPRT